MNKKKIGQFGFLFVLLIAVYFGYQAYVGGDEEGGEEQLASVNATEAGQKILMMLQKLEKIHLDGELFSNPAFMSLEDSSVDIQNQPQGRPNPFAPIGQDDLSLLEDNTDEGGSEEEESGAESGEAGDTNSDEPDTTISNVNSESETETETETNETTANTDTNNTSEDESDGSNENTEEESAEEEEGSNTFGESGPPPAPPAPGQ